MRSNHRYMQQISIKYTSTLALLQSLVNQQTLTTLIICWSRKVFFTQLLTQILQFNQNQSSLQEIPSSQPDDSDEEPDEEPDEDTQPTPHHPFLTPTLKLLAASSHIQLIYCPTVPTLRAYLSSISCTPTSATRPSTKQNLLILDLLSLHHATSENTLQGLSRTFSTAVSAAHRMHSHLTLLECKDITDHSNPHRGSQLWNQEVPLLSGSVKIGADGARWAGRSITVRKIARRWFTFEDQSGTMKPDRAGQLEGRESDVDEMLI